MFKVNNKDTTDITDFFKKRGFGTSIKGLHLKKVDFYL